MLTLSTKTENNNELKEVDITNRACYYFKI